jgi:hypothetical protein
MNWLILLNFIGTLLSFGVIYGAFVYVDSSDLMLGIILLIVNFGCLVFNLVIKIADWYLSRHTSKQTIEDVKENIIDCLDETDGLGYEIMFRTPECAAYKDCKLHIAKTEDGKEVIMIDLI